MWIIAHGALGNYDEIVFLGMGIIFVVMIIYSYFRSRHIETVNLDDVLLRKGDEAIRPPDHIELD